MLSEPFSSMTACEVLPVLCPVRIPVGRLAKPLLGKIQKGPHLRWHHAMRRKDPEDAARLRGDHRGPLGKHVPQATHLDILADQPCREEYDSYSANRRIAQRLGVVGAQRAGDGYLLESIACLRLVTKEQTIGRLQRIDKTIVLQRSIGSAIGGLRSR